MTTKTDILQAIRRKCMDGSCFQPTEIQKCPVYTCDLWPFRLGRDPDPSRTRGFAKSSVYTDDTGESGGIHTTSSAAVETA